MAVETQLTGIRYVLFDLDGTLTDSREGILRSLLYAFEKLGDAPPDGETLLRFIGPPLLESFRDRCGYSQERGLLAVQYFRERYDAVGKFENLPAPGIAETMGRLKERGLVLALASSKPEPMCMDICDKFGFTPHLHAIVGSRSEHWDKARVIREALARLGLDEADRSSAVMVGDRKYDVEGAARCGLPCVGVEFFGYAEPGELAAAGAAAVVDSVDALERYLLRAAGSDGTARPDGTAGPYAAAGSGG